MAVRLLSQPVIENNNLNRARLLLTNYCSVIEEYFGKQDCTYNAHGLTHFADQVPIFGPLPLITAYTFESTIGIVKRKFHGSRNVTEQTAKKVVENKNISKYHQSKILNNESTLLNLTTPTFKRKRKQTESIGDIKITLPYKTIIIDPDLRQNLIASNVVNNMEELLENVNEINVANRIIKKNEMIHSMAYPKRGESCSYLIGWNQGIHKKYGAINRFFKLDQLLLADINEYQISYYATVTPTVNTIGHFIAVESIEYRQTIICCSNIIGRVIFAPCNGENNIIGYLSPVLALQHD
jgi:hypothetical protein